MHFQLSILGLILLSEQKNIRIICFDGIEDYR